MLDFSLIRVTNPIPKPETIRYLKIRVTGVDASVIPNDHRQHVSKPRKGVEESGFEVTVRCEGNSSHVAPRRLPQSEEAKYLASNMAVQSDHEEIKAQAREIAGSMGTDEAKVNKLVTWTAENVENAMKDTFSSLSVLREREGECQAHSILYAAFARSLKIPTRVVTGLVYIQDVGFFYHAWAESYTGGSWLAVDPTLNQVPADATHIKISTGDSMDDVATLLKIMGKIKIDVLEFK